MAQFGFRDAFKTFKQGFKSGPTEPGIWQDSERFGRFQGEGEVDVQVEIPAGPLAVSIEDYLDVQDLEFELTGPGGQPLEMKRYSDRDIDTSDPAIHRLCRIATGDITQPGLHHLRVKAPVETEPMLIMVGEELTAKKMLGDMAEEMIPGRKLWKRLRGEN